MAEADDVLVARLRAALSGRVVAGEPLAAHTTLRVGGPAAALVTAETVADLVALAQICTDLGRPWLVVGRGSNLLVADQGWPGVAVVLGRGFRGVTVDTRGDVVAGAAEPMPVLAADVARRGLGGLAFGVAIPGSLGGAVRMNAGAMGADVAGVLAWVEVVRLDRAGAAERWAPSDLAMGYRHTALPEGAVVVRAALRLRPTPPDEVEFQMRTFRQWRRDNQPVNQPSCGSVFRNPPGDSAGRLIDLAGCKGHRVGGAAVSQKHANFITVEPGARARDVERVITDVRAAVAERTGVVLETEVVLAGFDAQLAPGGRG